MLVEGGTVVLKPAPEAATAAIELGRIALDVLPRGVLNVVTTRDVDVAIALTLDERVDAVSLTGSPFVAERMQVAGERAGKRVRLDVGGSAHGRAWPTTPTSRRSSPRRRTTSRPTPDRAAGSRASVVVPVHRHAEALQAAVAAMADVAVGDPTDPATRCGPLRSVVARDRVRRYVDLGRAEGGDVALGGQPLDRPGWWFARRSSAASPRFAAGPRGGARPGADGGPGRLTRGRCAHSSSSRCGSASRYCVSFPWWVRSWWRTGSGTMRPSAASQKRSTCRATARAR